MKTNIKFKQIIAYTLILTILTALPTFAADGEDKSKKITIEYDDIEELVKKDNRQLMVINDSITDLEDAKDASRDAMIQMSAEQEKISARSEALDAIIKNPLANSDEKTLAESVKVSLALSNSSLQTTSTITNGQITSSKLNLEQAEISMVNSSEKMFVLINQLENNLEQMKLNRELMVNQFQIVNKRFELKLVPQSVVTDMESSIKEFDASYSSLVHQLDALLIQFKGILDIPLDKDIELGKLPSVDEDYINEIELEEDIDLAIKNSLSLKIKKQEHSNNKTSSKTRKNEIKLKENEIKLGITNQYNLLLEKIDTLKLSESKLNSLNGKLIKEELRYNIGLISLMDLKSITNELEAQKTLVKSNASNLFMEIENYKAMLNGMI